MLYFISYFYCVNIQNDFCYLITRFNTVPSNQSMTRDGSQKGNYIIRGFRAKAWRVRPGKFELIDDPEGVPRTKGI